MSWRGREERSRWDDRDRDRWSERERERGRSPVWEMRRSPERERHERPDRERRHERERDDRDRRDRYDRDADRFRSRERYDRSDRSRERDRRRSPRRHDDRDIPSAPSPPKISSEKPHKTRSHSRSRSNSRDNDDYKDSTHDESQPGMHPSTGDWICKCGSYNFKRRLICFKRNCLGKRSDGTVYGGEAGDHSNNSLEANAGITKRLLFRRLDALTTEEKILDAIKDRCSKSVLDSIAGITIGREALTGASKCLAYINFNSIADSTAAHSDLMSLNPPLEIDGREVLISFFNEPPKVPKTTSMSTTDYAAYYTQMTHSYSSSAALSEADRVNAAAAVAQSAISAAQARNMQAWTPVAVPTFVASTVQVVIPPGKIPTGDGKTTYTAPDVRTFLYDETSGYYYDPSTGLYYDGATQYFYNSQNNQYMYWDASTSTYIAATQTQQNTEQPKLPNPPEATAENTIAKEPEEKKKKEKEDKVKVAKKIAKDMERWARTLNQKKENARSNIVMEQPLDMGASKGSADIGFSVLGSVPSVQTQQPIVRELSPPPAVADEFLMKKTVDEPTFTDDTDDGIIDWVKLTCLLCKRRFPTAEVLTKHKTLSDLHKQNLAEHRKKMELMPQPNGYRDRAAERRMKFGEDEPIIRKRYSPPPTPLHAPQSAPPPNVADTIGGKMLQKMGWSMGRGLGKTEQGRVAPVEASAGPAGAGLGSGGTRRGIYTPTPGETYRDTVKKLMIARYKEVIGQEEGQK